MSVIRALVAAAEQFADIGDIGSTGTALRATCKVLATSFAQTVAQDSPDQVLKLVSAEFDAKLQHELNGRPAFEAQFLGTVCEILIKNVFATNWFMHYLEVVAIPSVCKSPLLAESIGVMHDCAKSFPELSSEVQREVVAKVLHVMLSSQTPVGERQRLASLLSALVDIAAAHAADQGRFLLTNGDTDWLPVLDEVAEYVQSTLRDQVSTPERQLVLDRLLPLLGTSGYYCSDVANVTLWNMIVVGVPSLKADSETFTMENEDSFAVISAFVAAVMHVIKELTDSKRTVLVSSMQLAVRELFLCDTYFRMILRGLADPMNDLRRKRAMFLLKSALSIAEDPKQPITKGKKVKKIGSQNQSIPEIATDVELNRAQWEIFVIVYDSLDEFSVHLAKSVLGQLHILFHPTQTTDTGILPAFSVKWTTAYLNRAFTHPNHRVRRVIIQHLLTEKFAWQKAPAVTLPDAEMLLNSVLVSLEQPFLHRSVISSEQDLPDDVTKDYETNQDPNGLRHGWKKLLSDYIQFGCQSTEMRVKFIQHVLEQCTTMVHSEPLLNTLHVLVDLDTKLFDDSTWMTEVHVNLLTLIMDQAKTVHSVSPGRLQVIRYLGFSSFLKHFLPSRESVEASASFLATLLPSLRHHQASCSALHELFSTESVGQHVIDIIQDFLTKRELPLSRSYSAGSVAALWASLGRKEDIDRTVELLSESLNEIHTRTYKAVNVTARALALLQCLTYNAVTTTNNVQESGNNFQTHVESLRDGLGLNSQGVLGHITSYCISHIQDAMSISADSPDDQTDLLLRNGNEAISSIPSAPLGASLYSDADCASDATVPPVTMCIGTLGAICTLTHATTASAGTSDYHSSLCDVFQVVEHAIQVCSQLLDGDMNSLLMCSVVKNLTLISSLLYICVPLVPRAKLDLCAKLNTIIEQVTSNLILKGEVRRSDINHGSESHIKVPASFLFSMFEQRRWECLESVCRTFVANQHRDSPAPVSEKVIQLVFQSCAQGLEVCSRMYVPSVMECIRACVSCLGKKQLQGNMDEQVQSQIQLVVEIQENAWNTFQDTVTEAPQGVSALTCSFARAFFQASSLSIPELCKSPGSSLRILWAQARDLAERRQPRLLRDIVIQCVAVWQLRPALAGYWVTEITDLLSYRAVMSDVQFQDYVSTKEFLKTQCLEHTPVTDGHVPVEIGGTEFRVHPASVERVSILHMLEYIANQLNVPDSVSLPESVEWMRAILRTIMNEMTLEDEKAQKKAMIGGSTGHAMLLRSWQNLALLVPYFRDGDQVDEAITFIETWLPLPVPTVMRYYMEVFAVRLCRAHPERVLPKFIELMVSYDVRSVVGGSYLLILGLVSLDLKHPRAREFQKEVLLTTLPWLGSATGNVRSIAQHVTYELSLLNPELVHESPFLQRLISFQRDNKEIIRMRTGIQALFAEVNAIQGSSLTLLLAAKPNEEGELYPKTFIDRVKSVVTKVFSECAADHPEWALDVGIDPNKVALHAAEQDLELNQLGGGNGVNQITAQALSFDFQQKITPWDALDNSLFRLDIPQEESNEIVEIANVEKLSTEDRTLIRGKKQELIVVASLVDKLPNLAGLARTCEIFQADRLVVHDANVKNMKQFTQISVTAEKWVELEEVKPDRLDTYLLGLKDKGYMVVGLEQTANSANLVDYAFPTDGKVCILLGEEKTGIPVNLIQLVDRCIEIPQLGIIRSLNVHVSGAILIWEYTKQRMLLEKSQS